MFTDLPVSHKNRSEVSCEKCCCHLSPQSQPGHGGERSQWHRQLYWGLPRVFHNEGDSSHPRTPRHVLKHRSKLEVTQSGQPEVWATLETGQNSKWVNLFKSIEFTFYPQSNPWFLPCLGASSPLYSKALICPLSSPSWLCAVATLINSSFWSNMWMCRASRRLQLPSAWPVAPLYSGVKS